MYNALALLCISLASCWAEDGTTHAGPTTHSQSIPSPPSLSAHSQDGTTALFEISKNNGSEAPAIIKAVILGDANLNHADNVGEKRVF